MNRDIKGISIVYLSETGLTNMNSGEGEGNFVEVKKYVYDGEEYAYVSGQAMRHYYKEAIRRSLPSDMMVCAPNDKGESCGNIKDCVFCDLFGFMLVEKGKGSTKRVSVVKMSPAVSLIPMSKSSTVDFLVRRKDKKSDEDKDSSDIVNVELTRNIYKCAVSIDIARVGAVEVVDQKQNIFVINDLISEEEKERRIELLLDSVMFLTDFSKQARLLTDFTADVLLISADRKYTHRLQKALEFEKNSKRVDIERFKAVCNTMKKYSTIFLGIIPGVLDNEVEFIDMAKNLGIFVGTPTEAIEATMEFVRGND